MKKYFLSLILCCSMYFPCWGLTQIGIIGDSISLPFPVLPYLGYPAQLQKKLEDEGYAIRIINASQGGSTSDTALSRFKDMLDYEKIDILIIALGVNDGWSGLGHKHICSCLDQTIEAALNENIYVLLGTVDFIPHQPGAVTISQYRYYNHFISIYQDLKCIHPEITLFPFITQKFQYDISYHSIDHIHINPKGHAEVADHLHMLIKPLIDSNFINLHFETTN